MRIELLEEAQDDLIHQVIYGHRRCLSKRFPFAVYYSMEGNNLVRVQCRIGLPQEPVMDQEAVKGRWLTGRSSRPPEAAAELGRWIYEASRSLLADTSA